MKAITIKPEYNLKGVSNVILKDEVAFIDIDGEKRYIYDEDAGLMNNLMEMFNQGDE